MNFYFKFFNIHIREKKLTCHDYYGLIKIKCLCRNPSFGLVTKARAYEGVGQK